MSAVELVIAILALWRVVSLLSNEEGPGNIFIRLRAKIGIAHDDAGRKLSTDGSYLAELVYCPWCLSVVLGVPCALLWLAWPAGALWLSLPFALSAGALVLEMTIGYTSLFKKR